MANSMIQTKATALIEAQAIPPNVLSLVVAIFQDLIKFLQSCGPLPPARAVHDASLPTRAAAVHTRRLARRRLAGTQFHQYEDAVVSGVPVIARRTSAAEMEAMYAEVSQ